MFTDLLEPLVSKRFREDARYREGHLRIINALPERRVLGLHIPEMKQVARHLAREEGMAMIHRLESVPDAALCYEETVIWGYMINLLPCTVEERLVRLAKYVPVLDNWAVCDSYCAHAKWMARVDPEQLWAFLVSWFASDREFEVRFALVAAMSYLLRQPWLDRIFTCLEALDFDHIHSAYCSAKGKPERPQQGSVQGAVPYYVRMGVAWLLAAALAKFPEETRAYIRTSSLPEDVKQLYRRKARESFRTRGMETE